MAGMAAARLLDAQEAPAEPPPARECPVCRTLAGPGAPSGCECGAAYVESEAPQLLAGKFRLTRRLSAGGMGAVYLARDLGLDRDVAVKTLAGTPLLRLMQLKAEAWAMVTVAHPAVAQVHGIESWRGRPFLVTEFLPGGTLRERLLQGPVPVTEAVGAIAAGGTLLYVSPEALSGTAAAEADDVWSLCVVLYEAVSGRHPFAGGSANEVAERIRCQHVARASEAPAGPAEEAVVGFAAAVLAAPVPQRPASARAFAEALRGIRLTH